MKKLQKSLSVVKTKRYPSDSENDKEGESSEKPKSVFPSTSLGRPRTVSSPNVFDWNVNDNQNNIRSQLLALYEDLYKSDKPHYKLADGRNPMMIIPREGMKDFNLVKIWNELVKDTTTSLNYEQFEKLLDSRLPEILKEDDTSVEQVTDC